MKPDESKPVRQGEELDLAALERWLLPQVPELRPPLALEQFPRGHSNLTYLLRDAAGREMVLRRPPFGAKAIAAGHDMSREHRILSRLSPVWPKAPRPLAYCADEGVLGAPFYVMDRVRGVVLRGGEPRPELTPELMRRLSESLVDTLCELHSVDLESTGLADIGHGGGYVERQVTGWRARYDKSRTDEIPEMEQASAWLAQHLPIQSGTCLIHNDFKYDNVVLDPGDLSRIVAVLDWEMATVGDPLMDLGTSLGYWLDPDDPEELRVLPLGPTALPGNLSRRQVVERYSERTGRQVADPLFYYVYGLFKIAVIAQQIYWRYAQGYTKDQRFAAMIWGVQALGRAAASAIERGRI